ncbi:cation efflux protein [Sistotremastrum niveocremeum HHB9708]|uniref:Cation efflux protein n=1 Tax=Sistotremastrum niveocremeum HHB9708 TaxID=1314777 RepID=A0A164UBT9_9AGAM|nr:cation efflux protein [Sistotremastrum niveocremeum HHB9708]
MGMSRSTRIVLLLVIDIVFFFVELISGYAVGSLALVADSFHMLNDILSLIVALYAIKLSKTSPTSRYSYGWHRAEILAALVNGVFLLALCFSIFMEALERFFSTPEISSPRLIVIVGSLGLASNIVGLFLFHEHDHSHDHAHTEPKAGSNPSETTPLLDASEEEYPESYGHPIQTRALVSQRAREIQYERASSPTPSSEDQNVHGESSPGADGETLVGGSAAHHDHDGHSRRDSQATISPNNNHGHSHGKAGAMNMQALVLHVLGDALGNVGVIATGLVIWLSSWQYKDYFDPCISLFITVIIFSSAMPLVRSASFILLQGVPSQVSLDEVEKSIREVPGVKDLHDLHVWQLSETKNVASVHVTVPTKADFMPMATAIKKALHHHNIHSCTIQPEFVEQQEVDSISMTASDSQCRIACPPDQCGPDNVCCPPSGQTTLEITTGTGSTTPHSH